MDAERLEQIKRGHLLDLIRERPAMYLGERSLTALFHFLHGFSMGLHCYDIAAEPQLPQDFHDWVAYRLHFYESTSGYRKMILQHVPDEVAALNRFYDLLDEYRTRKPRMVARGSLPGRDFDRQILRDPKRQKEKIAFPLALNLVAYTDDPGFFVLSDNPDADFPRKNSFFATVQWFERWFGIDRSELTILDSGTFDRWLREENRFRRERDSGLRSE